MVAEYLRVFEQRESKVIEFRSPGELRSLVDMTLPEEGQSEEAVLQCCRDALKYSVNTCKLSCVWAWVGLVSGPHVHGLPTVGAWLVK